MPGLPESHYLLQCRRRSDISRNSRGLDGSNSGLCGVHGYDLHGQYDYGNQWAQAGCPLGNCLRHQTNLTEMINALSMVTKAGMPSHKVVVGVTSYGRSFKILAVGCIGPMCTYTGSNTISNARSRRCTGTAGWLGDAEIREILATNPSASTQFGQTSQSDIMIYNMNEWVGYMSPATKALRTARYLLLNMGGTVDWAIDLADVEGGSSVDEDGTPSGTRTRHRSPASATVISSYDCCSNRDVVYHQFPCLRSGQ